MAFATQSAAASELQQHLDQAICPDRTPEALEAFQIDTHAKLNWALGKMRDAQQMQAEREAVYHDELGRLNEWIMASRRNTQGNSASLRGMIEAYLRSEAEAGHKPSAHLPNGQARLSRVPAQITQIEDQAPALLAHARTWASQKNASSGAISSAPSRSRNPPPTISPMGSSSTPTASSCPASLSPKKPNQGSLSPWPCKRQGSHMTPQEFATWLRELLASSSRATHTIFSTDPDGDKEFIVELRDGTTLRVIIEDN